MNKTEELEAFLLEHSPHVVTITETWLSSRIPSSDVFPPGYIVLRKDRCSRGGGVAILVRDDIPTMPMPDVEGIEALWCKISVGRFVFFVGVMYRPPNADCSTLHALVDYMQRYVHETKKIILTGDFNLSSINWATLDHGTADSYCAEALLEIAFNFGLKQIIHAPTRVTQNSSSILDLTFLSDSVPDNTIFWETVTGIADHKATTCSLTLYNPPQARKKNTQIYDWTNADDVSVLDFLEESYPEFLRCHNDEKMSTNDLWMLFKTNVHHCLVKFIPQKIKTVRKSSPWISREIIHLKRKISRLRKLRHKRTSHMHYSKLISELSRTMKTAVKTAKQKYLDVTLSNFIKTAPHKFWHYLKSKDTKRSNLLPTEALTKATQFNNFFQTVFTIDNNIIPDNVTTQCIGEVPGELSITEAGILSLLLSLDTKTSSGPDNIPNAFLRRYAEWVSRYLLLIFTKSLKTCEVPQEWKIAKIIPIHKSGDASNPSNFRPISLTCSAGKILEHLILKHIVTFVENHSLIDPNQHGFRSGLSTVTQLVETVHDLALTIDKRGQVDIVFLDLSKAFDRVSHQKLVYKLQSIFGHGVLTKWLKDYLSGRKQFVHFEGQSSQCVDVLSGVPQGTVLAPILFLLFINDIAKNIEATVRMFADDCIIYKEIHTVNDQLVLNNALKKIDKWCQDWQMTINVEKTVCMTVTRKKNPLSFPYQIHQSVLQRVNEHKHLGIILSSDLKWNKHVSYISTKSLSALLSLKRSLRYASAKTKLLAYTSLVRSIIEYGVICWFPHTKCAIAKLEGVQRRAARFIYNKYRRRDSPTELLRLAGLPTISDRARYLRVKFLFLLQSNSLKIDKNRFLTRSDTRNFRTKHNKQLLEYRFHNDTFRYSFFPQAIREWNMLPQELVDCTSRDSFLSGLSNYYFVTT